MKDAALSSHTPETSQRTWLQHRARPLLVCYALVLFVILFSPSSHVQSALVVDVSRVLQVFLPDAWVSFGRVEVLLNAVIIAPVAFLGSIVWPRLRWQEWTAYGFLGATCVELFQGLFLSGRSASFSDIVANTAGALIGALLHLVLMTPAREPIDPR